MVTKANPTELFDVEYKGLSTDEKPTDCAANSLFLELDTGKFYYFDGESWNELGTGGGGGGEVIYDGTMTFTGDGHNVAAYFTATALPADGDPCYVYVEAGGDEYEYQGVWEYLEDSGDTYYEAIFDEGTPISTLYVNATGTDPMQGRLSFGDGPLVANDYPVVLRTTPMP